MAANGSFESDFSQWTWSGNQGIVGNGTTYKTSNGNKAVAFNGGDRTPNGVLAQSFGTTPGRTYTLSFDAGALSFKNQQEQRLTVTVQGSGTLTSRTVSVFAPGNGTRYVAQTLTFVANTSTTTLTFRDASTATTAIDLMLDNVQVVAQGTTTSPAPTTGALTLAWDHSVSSTTAGYELRYGRTSASYESAVRVGYVTTARISNLVAGQTYYVTVVAYDNRGATGSPSNQVVAVITGTALRGRVDEPGAPEQRAEGGSDLNGNGAWDFLRYDGATGAWSLHLDGLNQPAGQTGHFPPGHIIRPADFNADGLTDFVAYDAQNGHVSFAINDGAGAFHPSDDHAPPQATVSVADFDNDGASDLLLGDPATGCWSRPANAAPFPPACVVDSLSEEALVATGDFDGDGRTDLFTYGPASGRWSFIGALATSPQVRNGQIEPGLQVRAGRPSAEGPAALFLYHPQTGGMTIRSADATIAQFGASPSRRLETADFDGDGDTDILLYDRSTGEWSVCGSDGRCAGGVWQPGAEILVAEPTAEPAGVLLHQAATGSFTRFESGDRLGRFLMAETGTLPSRHVIVSGTTSIP